LQATGRRLLCLRVLERLTKPLAGHGNTRLESLRPTDGEDTAKQVSREQDSRFW
jgi:hypothetical protein